MSVLTDEELARLLNYRKEIARLGLTALIPGELDDFIYLFELREKGEELAELVERRRNEAK